MELNSYIKTAYKVGIIIFIPIAILVSLFPPFNWDLPHTNLMNQLPIKQYNFLFGSNKQDFILKYNASQRSSEEKIKQKYFLLSRHLILSELFVNYLLAFFVSIGFGLVFVKFKDQNEVKDALKVK